MTKRQCSGLNKAGERCGGFVLVGSEPPVCLRHSMSDEEWRATASRGGHRRWEVKRFQDTRGTIEDQATRHRLLETVARLLDAKLPGTAEPDYEVAAYALLVLAQDFHLTTKEEVAELLELAHPKLAADPLAHRVLDLEGARQRLIDAYAEGRISREDLPAGLELVSK